jgi:hypothetical protein
VVAQFDERGLHFRYPTNWKLERQASEHGFSIWLQSPETAFFMLSLHDDLPTPEELAETALATLRQDYEDLEAEDALESLAGQPALGHDIRFFSLDLTNTAWTRCFETAAGTVLVMCQVTDLEAPRNEPVLRAICQSLTADEDG